MLDSSFTLVYFFSATRPVWSVVSRFGALARLLLKKGETFQLPPSLLGAHLPDGRPGGGGEGRGGGAGPTNQPTKRASTIRGRAGGRAARRPTTTDGPGPR